MLTIRPPLVTDIEPLQILARTVWQATYSTLISQAQIEYMLAERYSAPLIRAQLDDTDQAWRLAEWTGKSIGFAHARIQGEICKLDKLYIHPDYQRRGAGRALLSDIKTFARARAATRLRLQVNRGNLAAIAAYRHYGFTISEARVFDIGGGFMMDDYVMDMLL